MGALRVGVGGWEFAPWRGRFYPKGLARGAELAFASGALSSIEINGTFYRHQSRDSFARWRDETPEGFMFAVKAHRATTHGKDPTAAGPAIAQFLGSGVGALGAKLGPILWQFPHTRKFDPAAIGAFLRLLPAAVEGVKLRHAVEARHASFEDTAWFDLARAHDVAVVMVDSDKQALRLEVTADFVYARLQRNSLEAEEGYESAALDAWARRLTGWAKERDVFAYFISGDKERAPDAALAMLQRVRSGISRGTKG